MNRYLDTYCPECDAEVRAVLHRRPATISVRGENIDYIETVAVCPVCGQPIGDARIEGENLDCAYDIYRSKHGIMSPEGISNLRKSYGLSLREFSRFLGFGEQTIYRYEHGDIPDQLHSSTLAAAQTATGARHLLERNGQNLAARSVAAIEKHIDELEGSEEKPAAIQTELLERTAAKPSSLNGYRALDLTRVSALVFLLSEKCKDLYWTKLQKAMFFADMLFCEQTSRSLTGLSYAHATYGPVMDNMDEIRLFLTEHGIISFQQKGWGEVLVPQHIDIQPFDAQDLSLIEQIAEFVNSFNTAAELSEFSHHLRYWSENGCGQLIRYGEYDREVSDAIAARMRTIAGEES